MRRYHRVATGLALTAFFSLATFGLSLADEASLDPVKVGPTIYKQLSENARVRVLEASFKPGDKIAMHKHPDHSVYVVEGGKLKITKADGTSMVADAKAGDVLWMEAQTHMAENVGTTPVRVIVTELKEPMRMMHKMEKKSDMKDMKEMKK